MITASKMASLLGEQLFKINGQGPPPSKDFFQLVITRNQVVWTSWKISLRLGNRGAPPEQLKITHEDFQHDKKLRHDVRTVFGEHILDYTQSLCEGKFDYLERLPDDILLRIQCHLELKDMTHLAQVSHRFRKLCNSDKFWEQHVRNFCAGFTSDMEGLAKAMGWRKTFFTFFHKTVRQQREPHGSENLNQKKGGGGSCE
ncbi:F-box only protein 36a [Cololabis saira]|uniref:F-box only protein 36a n=1 Tax=Cololabis saira TaxID=129043 RepID=UPI002AD3CBBC|nr:F-box only protein 36a [Cololabis saira]